MHSSVLNDAGFAVGAAEVLHRHTLLDLLKEGNFK